MASDVVLPPTYEESQALLQKEEEVEESTCPGDFVLEVLFLISVPLIVIGHLYQFDCKVEKYIPIFLLVSSYYILGVCLLALGMRCYRKDITAYRKIPFSKFYAAWTVWCIIGSVWVYGANVNYEDITSKEYCNKTLYYCSWYLLTINWGVIGFAAGLGMLIGYCCGA